MNQTLNESRWAWNMPVKVSITAEELKAVTDRAEKAEAECARLRALVNEAAKIENDNWGWKPQKPWQT